MPIYKNAGSQKIAVYAYDPTTTAGSDPSKTGDAANITAEISKDGGVSAATNDVNPTELDATDHPGIYIFDLTQAETNADMIMISAVSATSNILLDPIQVFTVPGDNAALDVNVTELGGATQSATDLKDFADAGYDPVTNKVQGVVLTDTLTTYTGNTVQTGDSFARLGAPAGASVSADVAALPTQAEITGGAYALDTDANGRTRVVDGTGAGEISLTSGLIDGITGTISTLDGLDTAQDSQHGTTQSAVSALNDVSTTDLATALSNIHLDHLLAVDYDPATPPGVATALLNELIESDAGVSRFTVNALENGPSGSGASAASIADAVWDELTAGHVTASTFGKLLADVLADTNELQTDDVPGLIAALNDVSQSQITGGAYAFDTDANGRVRIVDGTGIGELDTAGGLIAGISGTIQTLDALDTAQDSQHSTTQAAVAALNDISVADILTTQMTESYAGDGISPTMAQAMFAIHQMLMQVAYSGTTASAEKLDGITVAFTATLDDATNPTSILRA